VIYTVSMMQYATEMLFQIFPLNIEVSIAILQTVCYMYSSPIILLNGHSQRLSLILSRCKLKSSIRIFSESTILFSIFSLDSWAGMVCDIKFAKKKKVTARNCFFAVG
jgi:hypothetical protein